MKTFIQGIVLITLVLLTTSVSLAQKSKIVKANKAFDTYSYIDAREIYLQVVENGYDSAEIFKKLGDTYYYNGDYDNASKWYTKLIEKYPGETEPIYFYRGAQSLKSIDKYEESDKLMVAYAALGGSGLIVKHFEDDPQYLKTIALNSQPYKVEKVSINTKFSDFGPSYYNDKLVFASNAVKSDGEKNSVWNDLPFLDLFEADVDDTGKLSNVTELKGDINTDHHESSATFTKDGLTVYFTRNNFINGKKGKDKSKTIRLKLYKATLTGDALWTNVTELPFNNEEYSAAHPALSLDEKRLYFSSDMPGTIGESDIWYVDVFGDNQYSDPVNLGTSINTEARETFPFISDKNNLFFSSDGRSGLGGLDIFITPLNDEGKPGVITNLGAPANSKLDDFGFIIKEEKRIGYLSSNRDGSGGSVDDEIYRVQVICEINITGTVVDADSNALLPGSEVSLLDQNNMLIDKVIVGEDATYAFLAECESQYTIRATKEGYSPNEKVVETPSQGGSIEVPLPLTLNDPCPSNDLGCRLCLQPIFFDFDKWSIRPDAEVELAKILAAMRQYPELIITIESHTDSRADFNYNEALSTRRAKSTLEWLVDNGISRKRLFAIGYGESQLIDRCSSFDECGKELGAKDCTAEQLANPKCSDGVECSEEEHQINRRSMFINRYNLEISNQDVVVEQANMTSQDDAEMSTYTIMKGNTLYSLARRFNMSVDTLKGYNGLTSNNISVGQVLILHAGEK
ncbi:MAG: outer membrane protein OmpA-like peptidoglycan-associated protein [Saprospiraceae bacterium]|jgi:outer membrane protein OmpA-like peptidoglycan-associated protein